MRRRCTSMKGWVWPELARAREDFTHATEEYVFEMVRAGKWSAPLAASKMAQARAWAERQDDLGTVTSNADRMWRTAHRLIDARLDRVEGKARQRVR